MKRFSILYCCKQDSSSSLEQFPRFNSSQCFVWLPRKWEKRKEIENVEPYSSLGAVEDKTLHSTEPPIQLFGSVEMSFTSFRVLKLERLKHKIS